MDQTSSTEPRIKSYGFYATLEFVEKNYDDAAKKRILSGMSAEAKAAAESSKKVTLAKPDYSTELWQGIVKEHSQAEAVDQLVKTGRYMGSYATSTYLKLLMKMLTVKMFAKKFPDIWARDANFGTVETDINGIETGQIKVLFKINWPYFGPINQGWLAFGMETMGLKNVKVELENWSIDKPDPGDLTYRINWTK